MPNGDPVLAARFAVPPVPETFVRRPRLLERLDQGLRHPLLVVNGSAGAGKTLLVADWIGGLPAEDGQAVWLTLEDGDDAPGIFWACVLAALRHHGLTLPDDIGSPARPDAVDQSLLARLAAYLSGQRPPVLLVLDEFERAFSLEVASELQFLVRHAADGLRLVLLSRIEPLLPLHRYRAAGEMSELRGADLAFTAQETAELLRRHGLEISGEGVQALTERTEGWVAGIRLSALATQGADDPERFLREFEAGQSTVADFLLAEVLDAQPEDTQDLLLRTSILEQTHPELANALTGRQDAERILSELQRANAFVEPIGHLWYRHHPLFAEILQVHLHARHPDLETELHRRAARWLCRAGRLDDALPHAAAAGEWDFAAAEFVDQLAIGRLFAGLGAERLSELFAGMRPDTAGPAAELIRAAGELARFDVQSGLRHLRAAEQHLRAGSPADAAAAQLSCAFLRVLAGRLLGSADMAQSAAEAAEKLEREVPARLLEQHPELPALLRTDLGSALLWEGRFDAARKALRAAVESSGSPDTAYARHESLSRLALLELLLGWPAKAEAHARRALFEAERCGLAPSAQTGVGHLVLGAVAIERDELRTARAALARAEQSSAALQDPIVAKGQAILRSRLALAEGDITGALEALTDVHRAVSVAIPSPWVDERVAMLAAQAYLAEGDAAAALEVLDREEAAGLEYATIQARAQVASGESESALRTLDQAPAGGAGPAVTVGALLVRAEAAVALGNDATAERLVSRALVTARPELLRRPFRESGPWLRRLLRNRPGLARAHYWLPPDLLPQAPLPGRDGQGPAELLEPLSEREHEVLETAAQMMSTEEIAAALHLSVNTVKTHLKSINRKLSATRRGEAVRRAKELHLL